LSSIVDLLLWQLRAAGTCPVPIAEYRFHPTRRWRFDLAWPSSMVAVEVDGGTWSGGRHTTGRGIEADAQKFSHAAAMGWRVLRFTREMVESGQGLALIEEALG
jgi:very-short-patch-repair endonuclease